MDWKTICHDVLLVGLFATLFMTMMTTFNRVNGRLDTMQGEMNRRFDMMQVENQRQHDDMQKVLRHFEKRITRLEERTGIDEPRPGQER